MNNIYLYREFYGEGRTFYVFLNSAIKGSSAFYMTGNVWVDQEVILIRPRYVGKYKDSHVLELTNVFLPIKSVPEIRDKLDYKIGDDDFGRMVCNPFLHLGSCGDDKHLLKSYR